MQKVRLTTLCGIDCLFILDFKFYFTPSLGFFSPFPYGTCALSVIKLYLGFEGEPPIFRQDNTCPVLLKMIRVLFSLLCIGCTIYVCHFFRHCRAFTFLGKIWSLLSASCVYIIRLSLWPFIRVRSPLLTESRLIYFFYSYLDVSVRYIMDVKYKDNTFLKLVPHSDICRSQHLKYSLQLFVF